MDGKFLGEGAIIIEELEFILKERRLCLQDSSQVIGLLGRAIRQRGGGGKDLPA